MSFARKLRRSPPSLSTLVSRVRARPPKAQPGGELVHALGAERGYGNIVHNGWSVILSMSKQNPCCERGPDHEHWHLSLRLVPLGRGSTLLDWDELGRIVGRLQCDTGSSAAGIQPLTPFETTDPNAAHHWAWTTDDIPCAALRLEEDVTRRMVGGTP
jgi:hypothetical protein